MSPVSSNDVSSNGVSSSATTETPVITVVEETKAAEIASHTFATTTSSTPPSLDLKEVTPLPTGAEPEDSKTSGKTAAVAKEALSPSKEPETPPVNASSPAPTPSAVIATDPTGSSPAGASSGEPVSAPADPNTAAAVTANPLEEIQVYEKALKDSIAKGANSPEAIFNLMTSLKDRGFEKVDLETSVNQNSAGIYTPEPYVLPDDLLGPRQCYRIQIRYCVRAEKGGETYQIPLERTLFTTAEDPKEAVRLAMAYQKMTKEKIEEEKEKNLSAWATADSFTFSKDYSAVSFKKGKTEGSLTLSKSTPVVASWKDLREISNNAFLPGQQVFSSREEWLLAKNGVSPALDFAQIIQDHQALDRARQLKKEIKELELKAAWLKKNHFCQSSLRGWGPDSLDRQKLAAAAAEAEAFKKLKEGKKVSSSLQGSLGDYQAIKEKIHQQTQKIGELNAKRRKIQEWTNTEIHRFIQDNNLEVEEEKDKKGFCYKFINSQIQKVKEELENNQSEAKKIEQDLEKKYRNFYGQVGELRELHRELKIKLAGLKQLKTMSDDPSVDSQQAKAIKAEISSYYVQGQEKKLEKEEGFIASLIQALEETGDREK